VVSSTATSRVGGIGSASVPHFKVPRFEVIDEVLFEVGSEISEDHLDLGLLALVEYPEVEFGGRRVPNAVGGEDPAQAFDEVRSTGSQFADERDLVMGLEG
jgi:hypothetical protein